MCYFCDGYNQGLGQRISFYFDFNYTLLRMGHYRKWFAYILRTTEPHRHSDRMHHYGQRIESVEPSI